MVLRRKLGRRDATKGPRPKVDRRGAKSWMSRRRCQSFPSSATSAKFATRPFEEGSTSHHIARRCTRSGAAYVPCALCISCHRYYHDVLRVQPHLNQNKDCLARVALVCSPLSEEHIMEAETASKQRERRCPKGAWQLYRGGPAVLILAARSKKGPRDSRQDFWKRRPIDLDFA